MTWIKNFIKKKKKAAASKRLLALGLEFRKTALGQAVFIPIGDDSAHRGLFPDNWTIAQLRAMADYMEADPNITLFSDGSGKPCK